MTMWHSFSASIWYHVSIIRASFQAFLYFFFYYIGSSIKGRLRLIPSPIIRNPVPVRDNLANVAHSVPTILPSHFAVLPRRSEKRETMRM